MDINALMAYFSAPWVQAGIVFVLGYFIAKALAGSAGQKPSQSTFHSSENGR